MDPSHRHVDRPAWRGALAALAAAVLFGISTPLLQVAGAGIDSFWTAALLYAGASLCGLAMRQPSAKEAAVTRADVPRIVAMAAFGAAVGPIALAWGLQHTSGASASLMLSFEAVATTLLAVAFYAETLDARLRAALALTTAGAAVLVLDRVGGGGGQVLGLLAVLVATVAWGLDNALSRGVATRDPGQVVMLKGAVGASMSLVIAVVARGAPPPLSAVVALAVIGAIGYGLSLRLYLLAQRAFGAARTASVFAAAPFVGAAVALAWQGVRPSPTMGLGALLLVAGLVLHLFERHSHRHVHQWMDHEHAHDHHDGHHDHEHPDGDAVAAGSHSHRHVHAPTRHSHPHVPDEHHSHSH